MTPILFAPNRTSLLAHLADATACEVTEERNGIYELYLEIPIASEQLESAVKKLKRDLETIDKMLKHASKHLEVNSVLEALKTTSAERDPSTPPPANNVQQGRNQ